MEPLVSIVTPIYNGSKTIKDTIESVINQTYKNFEMIIVDDVSEDDTVKIIKKYREKDQRIKLITLGKKSGASIARNKALNKAKGKYIAFLDGDDLWKKDKLEKQIKFMEDNNICFSYTDYSYIDENGNDMGIYRKCPQKMSYLRMLLGDSVGCLTVIYNREKVGKIEIPKLRKRNDYALWCLVLKKIKVGYKYNEILSLYRKNTNSLSSGKKYRLLKYHYQLHRSINKFGPVVSVFLTFTNIINFLCNRYLREKKLEGREKK